MAIGIIVYSYFSMPGSRPYWIWLQGRLDNIHQETFIPNKISGYRYRISYIKRPYIPVPHKISGYRYRISYIKRPYIPHKISGYWYRYRISYIKRPFILHKISGYRYRISCRVCSRIALFTIGQKIFIFLAQVRTGQLVSDRGGKFDFRKYRKLSP